MTVADRSVSPAYDAPTSSPGWTTDDEPPARWTPAQLIGFRFLFAYFVLYDAPSLLGSIPVVGVVAKPIDSALQGLALWTGAHILHLARPIIVAPTGSGDTMKDYVTNLVILALASIFALVWSAADRERTEYRKLHEWLRIIVRFALAFIMFGYGFAKLFPNQFPRPTLERLVEPLGDFSPMGLLWTFMGYSFAYNIFTGLGESVGALLLCARRTTTAGALLLITVLSNVVILNFTYDVPVKIFSANLLLMAIFLAAPDIPRIVNLVIRHRRTDPSPIKPIFATPAMHRTSMVLRALLVAWVLFGNVTSGNARFVSSGPNAPKPPLYGIYDVQAVNRNGHEVPLVITDSSLWKRVVFSQYDRVSIRTMTDSLSRYTVKVDTVHHTAPADAALRLHGHADLCLHAAVSRSIDARRPPGPRFDLRHLQAHRRDEVSAHEPWISLGPGTAVQPLTMGLNDDPPYIPQIAAAISPSACPTSNAASPLYPGGNGTRLA